MNKFTLLIIFFAFIQSRLQAKIEDWDNVAVVVLSGKEDIISRAFLIKGDKQSIINGLISRKRALNSFGNPYSTIIEKNNQNNTTTILYLRNGFNRINGPATILSSVKIMRLNDQYEVQDNLPEYNVLLYLKRNKKIKVPLDLKEFYASIENSKK